MNKYCKKIIKHKKKLIAINKILIIVLIPTFVYNFKVDYGRLYVNNYYEDVTIRAVLLLLIFGFLGGFIVLNILKETSSSEYRKEVRKVKEILFLNATPFYFIFGFLTFSLFALFFITKGAWKFYDGEDNYISLMIHVSTFIICLINLIWCEFLWLKIGKNKEIVSTGPTSTTIWFIFLTMPMLILISQDQHDSQDHQEQCEAITKAGEQCSRDAEYLSDYCWQHENY